jgi:hypothetical protein
LFHFVRDTGNTIAIVNSNKHLDVPEIVFESGDEWLEYLSERLGCDAIEIQMGFRATPLGAAIRSAERARARKLKRELKGRQTGSETLEAQIETLNNQKDELKLRIERSEAVEAQSNTAKMTLGLEVGSLKKQLDEE